MLLYVPKRAPSVVDVPVDSGEPTVFQQTPRTNTEAPPSSVTRPPLIAVVLPEVDIMTPGLITVGVVGV